MSRSPAELFDLQDHHALVTGGGSGLGREFARVLSAAGAAVTICGRRLEKLEETAALIRASGATVHCLALDVSDEAGIVRALAGLECTPDILVNNAGAAADHLLLDVDAAEWDRVHDANLKGAWLVAREVVRGLIAAGRGGSIINIASILGSAVQKGTAPYAAAKAGLIQLTRVMALEWARHGIRVNAIAPGYYHTEMAATFLDSEPGRAMIRRIPQRRLGEPSELAGALLLLASGASAYMTGSVITVDGGLSLPVV